MLSDCPVTDRLQCLLAAFAEGEQIVEIEFSSDDWWLGTAQNGTRGLFPANYVELQQ